MQPTLTLRLATAADIPELVRLRRVMWTSMGLPVAEGPWEHHCEEVLAGWFGSGAGTAAVVELEPGRLVACGVASVDQRLPGSANPSGRHGYIANMVTDPDFRGRGLAADVLRALLDWFDGQGIATVDLHATPQGEPIYRAAGFSENQQVALRRRSS